MLSKTINGLFIKTYYGVWGLGVLGIFGSLILVFVNISLGMSSLLTCVALLCLSLTITMGLLPKFFIKGALLEKIRIPLTIITALLAISIMGIVYLTTGGFPELNLLFI